jgi:hypothetical protein
MHRTLPTTALICTGLLLAACGSDATTAASAGDGEATPTSGSTPGESTPGGSDQEPAGGSTPSGSTPGESTPGGSAQEPASGTGETARLWIKPELVDCEGVGPQTCLQVAESEDGDYHLFYDSIEGFSFEEGTTYVIDVAVEQVEDPPEDGSSIEYRLLDVVEEVEAG